MNTKNYKFEKSILSHLQEFEQKLFLQDFDIQNNNDFINISYQDMNYSCEDKINTFIDSKTQAISFFSGAGGLDIGAQLAGAKVISSLDFEKKAVETIASNKYFNHTNHIHGDISETNAKSFSKILKDNNPEKLMLIGGPPCQPFSKAGYWVTHKNRKGHEDPRNMIGQYLRMIDEVQPDGFLLENVESLLHPTNKDAVDNLKESIDKMGYHFEVVKANSLDYGVPQKRKRIFFIASKNKINSLPKKTHGSEKEILENKKLILHENVLNWIAKFDKEKFFEQEELTLNKTYSKELYAVPPGKNYIALTEKNNYPNPPFIANKRFWSFLLKLHPLLPSWTIAAQPGPWVGPFHWSGRRLRVPEIAAIQTFPEDYVFKGSRRDIQKQIGNAVPPLLGKAMVKCLMENI
jgi:DNA (cytosine-5)-methyltransferase 1